MKYNPENINIIWELNRSDKDGYIDHCVIDKNRLFNIVNRLLEIPKRSYIINLTGYKPSLHPMLCPLTQYILMHNIPIKLYISFNLDDEIDCFLNEIAGYKQKSIIILYTINNYDFDIKEILINIAKFNKYNLFTIVKIKEKTLTSDNFILLEKSLLTLKNNSLFNFDIVLERAHDKYIHKMAINENKKHFEHIEFIEENNESEEQSPNDSWQKPNSEEHSIYEDNLNGNISKEFCYRCLGTNFLLIDSDGYAHGFSEDVSLSNVPLWHEQYNQYRIKTNIIKCSANYSLGEFDDLVPKFFSYKNAKSYIKHNEKSEKLTALTIYPIKNNKSFFNNIENEIFMQYKKIIKSINYLDNHKFASYIVDNYPCIENAYLKLCNQDSFINYLKFILINLEPDIKDKVIPIDYKNKYLSKYDKNDLYNICLASMDNFYEIKDILDMFNANKSNFSLCIHPNIIDDVIYNIYRQYDKINLYFDFNSKCIPSLYGIFNIKTDNNLAITTSISSIIQLSIIILYFGNNHLLINTLNSIALQNISNIEVIILSYSESNINTSEINNFINNFPQINIKNRTYINTAFDSLLDNSINYALGKYITIVISGQLLPENRLKYIVTLINNSNPELVIFSKMEIFKATNIITINKDNNDWKKEIFTLIEAFENDFPNFNIYINNNFIKNKRITWNYFGTAIWQAFYYNIIINSLTIICITDNNSYSEFKTMNYEINNGNEIFNVFANTISFILSVLKFLDNNYAKINLNKIIKHEINLFIEILRHRYKNNQENIKSLICLNNLKQFARLKPAIQMILMDYASHICAKHGHNPSVAFNDTDWRTLSSTPFPDKTYSTYCENKLNSDPILTVVVPNYNKGKYISYCLQSIMNQPITDIEIIIVDDHSTDESWDILTDFADMHDNVGLYRLDHNCRQGICRNIAIEKARGKYITFVDSDDFIRSDFFVNGIDLAEKNNADIVSFASQKRGLDGTVYGHIKSHNGMSGPIEAFGKYMHAEIAAAPYAKIFNTKFVKDSNVRFAEYIYHQDHFFVGYILRKARRVLTSDKVGYCIVTTPNSAIRPATRNYLHIHSACMFYTYLESIYRINSDMLDLLKNHAIWNIENILLLALRAYYIETGEVAISDEDFNALTDSYVFLYSLLLGWCKLRLDYKQDCDKLSYNTIALDNLSNGSSIYLISICIYCYNNEKHLTELFDSINNQNLHLCEILFIDDASQDNSLSIINEYIIKHYQYKVFSNKISLGMERSFNKILNSCQGDYVIFMQASQNLEINPLAEVAYLRRDVDLGLGIISKNYIHGIRKGLMHSVSSKYMLEIISQGDSQFHDISILILRKTNLKNTEFSFNINFSNPKLFLIQNLINFQRVLLSNRGNQEAIKTDNEITFNYHIYKSYLIYSTEISRLFIQDKSLIDKRLAHSLIINDSRLKPSLDLLANSRQLLEQDIKNLASSPILIEYIFQKFSEVYSNSYLDTDCIYLTHPANDDIIIFGDNNEDIYNKKLTIVTPYKTFLESDAISNKLSNCQIIIVDDGMMTPEEYNKSIYCVKKNNNCILVRCCVSSTFTSCIPSILPYAQGERILLLNDTQEPEIGGLKRVALFDIDADIIFFSYRKIQSEIFEYVAYHNEFVKKQDVAADYILHTFPELGYIAAAVRTEILKKYFLKHNHKFNINLLELLSFCAEVYLSDIMLLTSGNSNIKNIKITKWDVYIQAEFCEMEIIKEELNKLFPSDTSYKLFNIAWDSLFYVYKNIFLEAISNIFKTNSIYDTDKILKAIISNKEFLAKILPVCAEEIINSTR